ncbi:MAG: NAD(P)H-hydrate dehydratase [Gammaproteobacteria bacterium]|nr:NAD(P)H-hydrate dehydratase [Gammaproteobacteria bacterium]
MDRLAIEDHGIAGFDLMQRAGRAAFAEFLGRWPEAGSISICCGKGNNAGDGYIIAGLAREIGVAVELVQLGDPSQLVGTAAQARDWALGRGVEILSGPTDELCGDVVVDALLGTGIVGDLRPAYRDMVKVINQSGRGVLALDVPTGVNSDTGSACDVSVRADVTVTFIGRKLGLHTGPGVSLSGDVVYARLGVPDEIFRSGQGCSLLRYERLPKLEARDPNAYKQALGHVVIVGGDQSMGGAALMAGEAALRVGAGLVSIVTRASHRPAILSRRPELMVVDADDGDARRELLMRATTLIIGPGLGRSSWGHRLLDEAIGLGKPLVLDADGLHGFVTLGLQASGPIIVTPHSGEAAVMLATTSKSIQSDRIAAAKQLAELVSGVAVLKGAGTVIAECDSDGPALLGVCGHGNPGMASAGMGDVLSGVVGGLLAQHLTPAQAAIRGVCLHSAAADAAAKQVGQRSLLATDLMPAMMELLHDSEQI